LRDVHLHHDGFGIHTLNRTTESFGYHIPNSNPKYEQIGNYCLGFNNQDKLFVILVLNESKGDYPNY
jgi:hypothetical protein